MNIDNETYCFMRLLKMLLDDDKNYLLPINERKNICSNKNLLGYYNRDYIYLIPGVVIGICDTVMIKQKSVPLNMQKVLKQFFCAEYDKDAFGVDR